MRANPMNRRIRLCIHCSPNQCLTLIVAARRSITCDRRRYRSSFVTRLDYRWRINRTLGPLICMYVPYCCIWVERLYMTTFHHNCQLFTFKVLGALFEIYFRFVSLAALPNWVSRWSCGLCTGLARSLRPRSEKKSCRKRRCAVELPASLTAWRYACLWSLNRHKHVLFQIHHQGSRGRFSCV
ncbi:hypothetical protein F5I97DRAFT_1430155 [Phlebopus sp. FC_14]|nr:hypothetical protein F5I97DRAFT_1430155 [Phlebopus sp. FC_14]